ncbi:MULTISPECIES: hypothetical protein [Legionella]|uniref:NHL repeat protein n=1 Tax=Legionella drozanskii LLAP-1 TaxID=1212489 RepID=A0A0W0SR30_9GAMM|nr:MULTISPECIES: hypothetical protein [Legionella]KTC85862.1 NHL repeat protein [Legionella drozanskii LLAP-1]PJE10902.1 MAG: hypothetical protein CK430_09595 [Legionella sp.]
MKTRFLLKKTGVGLSMLMMTAAQAGIPVWTFTPLTPTNIVVPSNGTANVKYQITNQSIQPHLLAMLDVPFGITQIKNTAGDCDPFFYLSTIGQSCTLNLNITGSNMISSSIQGGPKVCQLNSLECYQPDPLSILNIIQGPMTFCSLGGFGPSAPGVDSAIGGSALYQNLYYSLLQMSQTFTNDLTALQNAQTFQSGQDATYAVLKADADNFVASFNATNPSLQGGRLVIADPDGTVVYDSAKNGSNCSKAAGPANTFSCYLAKGVNENHNTRVSIMDAEMWPCGGGAERKFSTTVNQPQSYVALRLGPHLNGVGAFRLGVNS